MSSSIGQADHLSLRDLTASDNFAAGIHGLVRRIADVEDITDAIDLLDQAGRRLGASSSCFISFVRDGDRSAAFRMLLACDPQWGTEYVSNGWFESDPWLDYAMHAEQPIQASRLKPGNDAQREMVARSESLGFRSVVVAPSPTACGGTRAGVLYIASDIEGYFESEGFADIRTFAQTLSMELHAWWLQSLREELTRKARITESDLVLLRHEQRGDGSKVIAAALNTEGKTIDCRFQRLNAKLGVPNRRAAVRMARIYGLI